MNFEIININDKAKWDRIVKSFSMYDVYNLSGYVEAFRINGDGEPILIHYENKDTRAINVTMKRDISLHESFRGKLPKGKYFDLATPYGYGGVMIEGDDILAFNYAYFDYAKKHNIVSEFVRFNPIQSNHNKASEIYEIMKLGNTVFIDTKNEELIWANITSKNRNMIRKAQNSGLKTYWGRSSSLIEPFMNLYNATMTKDHADKYYFFDRNFYTCILNELSYNSLWFYNEVENEIASIAIFLFANGNMHYHLSTSNPKHQNLAPTNLLIYEAAKWAANNGISTLHLGGGLGSKSDSLYKFKKAFNRSNDFEFNIGKKIFDQTLYNELVMMRKNIGFFNEDSTFFPLYKLV